MIRNFDERNQGLTDSAEYSAILFKLGPLTLKPLSRSFDKRIPECSAE